MIEPYIHAVKAVYDSVGFKPDVLIQTSEPLHYKCTACSFSGNLEQGVEHVVTNQFIVTEPKKKANA